VGKEALVWGKVTLGGWLAVAVVLRHFLPKEGRTRHFGRDSFPVESRPGKRSLAILCLELFSKGIEEPYTDFLMASEKEGC
jgi:hypothetical protein